MSTTTATDFGFGPEEEMLRDLARQFLNEKLPVERLRELVSTDPEAVYENGERPAWDTALWKEMVELGWNQLAIPEASGGAGFKQVGIAALTEEIGRHALPSPFVATLNATHALAASEEPHARDWMDRIAHGASASLAIHDEMGNCEDGKTAVQITGKDGQYRLSGQAFFVQDAFKAEFLIAAAQHEGETWLVAIPCESTGLTLNQDQIHDLTRDQATVHLDEVPIAPENIVSRQATTTLAKAWPAILVTVAADLCGCAEWQLQTTTEYAKNRKQFDRPIGFFQAIKHPLVDAMVAIDRARSLLYHAASCIDAGDPEALQAARMAKSAASDAGAFISDRSVQLHGGIGFTWECDVHIFFKRSMHNQVLYGDGGYQRHRLAEKMIGPA